MSKDGRSPPPSFTAPIPIERRSLRLRRRSVRAAANKPSRTQTNSDTAKAFRPVSSRFGAVSTNEVNPLFLLRSRRRRRGWRGERPSGLRQLSAKLAGERTLETSRGHRSPKVSRFVGARRPGGEVAAEAAHEP